MKIKLTLIPVPCGDYFVKEIQNALVVLDHNTEIQAGQIVSKKAAERFLCERSRYQIRVIAPKG